MEIHERGATRVSVFGTTDRQRGSGRIKCRSLIRAWEREDTVAESLAGGHFEGNDVGRDGSQIDLAVDQQFSVRTKSKRADAQARFRHFQSAFLLGGKVPEVDRMALAFRDRQGSPGVGAFPVGHGYQRFPVKSETDVV